MSIAHLITFFVKKETLYRFLTFISMKCKARGTIVFSQFPGNFFLYGNILIRVKKMPIVYLSKGISISYYADSTIPQW